MVQRIQWDADCIWCWNTCTWCWNTYHGLVPCDLVLYSKISQYHTKGKRNYCNSLYYFDPSKLCPVTINMSSTVLDNEIIIPTAGKHGEQGMFIWTPKTDWMHMITKLIFKVHMSVLPWLVSQQQQLCETKGCPTLHGLGTQLMIIRPAMLAWFQCTPTQNIRSHT